MNLRPYQRECLDAIHTAWQQHQCVLAVLPTGTGKTVIFSHLIREVDDGRCIVLAHRQELVDQARQKIEAVTGQIPDVEMASYRADINMFRRAKAVVASVQTLCQPKRLEKFDPSQFTRLIIDEAHHVPAASYLRILSHFRRNPQLRVLGVTATPDRHDKAALGRVFTESAFVYEIADAVRDGWLVPVRQKRVVVEGLDYSSARTTAGDLNQHDIAKAQRSEAVLQGMCVPLVEIAGDRKTLVFCTPGNMTTDEDDFKIARRVEEIIARMKPGKVARVHAKTDPDERKLTLARFKSGEVQFLVNVGVFTEGFDEPGVEVVGMMRPTKSRALYAQMIGRGTRPLPGLVDGLALPHDRTQAIAASAKPAVDVVDFVGNSGRHKLVCAADILGGKDARVVQRAKKKLADDEDVMRAVEQAQREIEEEEEAERRRQVIADVKWREIEIDPFRVFGIHRPRKSAMSISQASPKQRDLLRKLGVTAPANTTRKEASALIDEALRRRRNKLPGFRELNTDKTTALNQRWKELVG